MQHIDPTINRPGFGTLLWDNILTTGAYGGAISAAGVSCTAAITLTAVAFTASGKIPAAGDEYIVGAVALGAGIVGGLVGGAVSATFLAPFFAYGALKTRQFKLDSEIRYTVDLLSSFTNPQDQQRFIDEIIQADDNLSWWGVRSITSPI